MKSFITLSLIVFMMPWSSKAQFSDVVTDVAGPIDMALQDGHILYYSQFSTNSIWKIDISIPNADPEMVKDNLLGPTSIALVKDELFISEFDGGNISKINITESDPDIIPVLTGLSSPFGLFIKDDDMYYVENTGSRISKFRYKNQSPESVLVLDNIASPIDVAVYGDELFYSLNVDRSINKINLLDSNPVPELVTDAIAGAYTISLRGDELFICEDFGGSVSKINLSEEDVMVENVISTLGFTTAVLAEWEYLFIGDWDQQKIISMELEPTSNKDAVKLSSTIFPNPASDFIQISGQNNEGFQIRDKLGQLVSSGKASDLALINISDLSPGAYVIRIGNESQFFIKI